MIIKEWEFLQQFHLRTGPTTIASVAFPCESTNTTPRHDPNQQSRRDSPPLSIFVDSQVRESAAEPRDFQMILKYSRKQTQAADEFLNCLKINNKVCLSFTVTKLGQIDMIIPCMVGRALLQREKL